LKEFCLLEEGKRRGERREGDGKGQERRCGTSPVRELRPRGNYHGDREAIRGVYVWITPGV
jgi:hypothetical protein